MTEKVANDMRTINNIVFNHPLSFVADEEKRSNLRRLSEEFAVNIAIQSNYPDETLITLKSVDNFGEKKSLQSLYYGCLNHVNE